MVAFAHVRVHQFPQPGKVAQEISAAQMVSAIDGRQGRRIPAFKDPALKRSLVVDGAGAHHRIIEAAAAIAFAGADLDQIALGGPDPVADVVMNRFTRTDGDEVPQRDPTLSHQFAILLVQDRPPLEAAGAAAAAVLHGVGDGRVRKIDYGSFLLYCRF